MVQTRVQLDDELFYWNVVPDWEHSFGIRFARDAFAHTATVGQVWAVVEQQLMVKFGEPAPGVTAACATQRTFYSLRRALVAQGVARAAVTPRLSLATLFPWRDRPRRWRHWQQASRLPLPALRSSVAVCLALWAGTTAAVCISGTGWGVALATGLCAALVGSTVGVTRWALPAATLAELTRTLVATEYQALTHPALRHNRGEWRDLVLAGLARCGTAAEDLDPNELYDGTTIAW
jgi:hypothetical protein